MLLKMAWRNVWRNRRRSLVTIGATALALLMMTLYSGMVEGYLARMERNILDRELGEIQVFAAGYEQDPSLFTTIDAPAGIVAELGEAGFRASSRLLGAGLAAANNTSAGVTFRGVDVESDRDISLVYEQVDLGTWLNSAEPSGVVVGRQLAKTLNLRIGDELVVLSQAADGSMANELYEIRGILKAISDNVDRAGVFMTEPAFRDLFVLPQGVHQIVVRTPENLPLAEAVEHVDAVASGLEVKSWREIVPTLASMLDSSRSMVVVMFFIVYLAIAIVVLNAMLMAVFERIREFGVLKALGMTPGRVWSLIWIESLVMTVVAIVIGLLASIPALFYLATQGINLSRMAGASVGGIAWDPIWTAEINLYTFLGPLVTLVVVVALAVIYPAGKAAFIRPVQAMRYR